MIGYDFYASLTCTFMSTFHTAILANMMKRNAWQCTSEKFKKKTRNSFMKLIFIFDLKIIFKFINMYYMHYKHCVQGNICPPPPFYFRPLCPRRLWANIRLGQFLTLFLSSNTTLYGGIQERGKTIYKWRRGKHNKGMKNNPVYSNCYGHLIECNF